MKIHAVEYDFNLVTIHGNVKESEHRVETFTDAHEFIKRVQELESSTNSVHEAFGVKVYTNIKTYGGSLNQIPLERVLNPFE